MHRVAVVLHLVLLILRIHFGHALLNRAIAWPQSRSLTVGQGHDRCHNRLCARDLNPMVASTKSVLFMTPTAFGENRSGIEVGIQTAQLLMDTRRRHELKKQLQNQYPLVPEAVLDSSIDITTKAFTQVAPEKLKIALRPGGMDRVRPEIERVIVDFSLNQPVIQNIPVLDKPEKRKLVELLVKMSLDFVLKDAQEVLSAPEVRLAVLEEQIKSVKAMMGPWRLFWYRLRHSTIEIAFFSAFSVAIFVVYQQRNVPVVAKAIAIASSVCGQVLAASSKLFEITKSGVLILIQKSIVVFTVIRKMLLRQ